MNDEELMHYGIKGMKWGVRRYQNEDGSLTSAGKKRQDKRDQRAAKYYDRANERQREIDSLNDSLKSTDKRFQKRKLEKEVKKLEKKREQDLQDAHAKEEGKLTKREKQIAIGAAVVAAYATYKFVDSGEMKRLVTKGRTALGKSNPGFKKNPTLSNPDMDADAIHSAVVSRINPDYGAIGTKNNCRRCTMAYEMSRRGYDVKATKSIGTTGQTAVDLHNMVNDKSDRYLGGSKRYMLNDALFEKGVYPSNDNYYGVSGFIAHKMKNIKKSDSDADLADSIFKTLAKEPNGSRGEVSLFWSFGGGHSIAYEVVKGKPVIFDCQSGKKFDSPESLRTIVNNTSQKLEKYGLGKMDFGSLCESTCFTRLDDKPINEDLLLRWLQNA